MNQTCTRNFSIIAHIDHGKSTLADRLIEKTALISKREMQNQVLDDMDLEKEKGITIKARSVRLSHKHTDGQTYFLNMIDTPGHVDFSYEVSRSLSACEGAILVIDASQGIQAQTIVNTHLAQKQNLKIILVINKIDLPNANPEKTKKDIEQSLGISAKNAILTSAKTGIGIDALLNAIINILPPPGGDKNKNLKALIFDSVYDNYRGVVIFIRIFEGTLTPKSKMLLMGKKREYDVIEIGVFTPTYTPQKSLSAGDVGYVIANIKEVNNVRVGDTLTTSKNPALEKLPGYKEVKPMVFSGFYPIISSDYALLKDALDKLKLNDASIFYEPESSTGIGFGFRCGFLGLLHMEIIQTRIEREFDIGLITTTPQVHYRAQLKSNKYVWVKKPTEMPEPTTVNHIEEPYITAIIILPSSFMGPIMQLLQNRRGIYEKTEYIDEQKIILTYQLPLAEVILDFYDKLKSLSSGYASFDYELSDYRVGDLVRLNIIVNGETVDSLSLLVERSSSVHKGRKLIDKLQTLIPRQLFKIVIQAAIGGKIIARADIRAIQKNVTSKCYGGDITRKRKLLEKQKEGKKRMKQIGNVAIPSEAFIAVLKID